MRPVLVYSTNELEWSTFLAQQHGSAIAVVNDRITLIGGHDVSRRRVSNTHTLDLHEEEGQWKPVLPPMPTGRGRQAIIHLS